MIEEEKEEKKVYVNGRLISISELGKEYPEISLSRSTANVKIVKTLIDAKKPLNREDIAKKAGLSKGHTIHVLKDFEAEDFVVEFQLGGRTRYYLLTEKGLKLAKEITS